MRLGIQFGGSLTDFGSAVQRVIDAEKDGFDTIVFNSFSAGEPLTVIAAAGRETSRIEMMTAVAVTYTRHPIAMAQQALTANAACGGRLTLGIGASHKPTMEALGFDYSRPAAYMREYVSVLRSLMETGKADFHGEFFDFTTDIQSPWKQACPVLISALAPLMLKAAGELADGTVTWMVGLETMKAHIIPRITAAAETAGRPAPRICIGLPVSVTDDVAAARERAARSFANYGRLPAYKRVLDLEGGGPEDVLVCGDEEAVASQLRSFAAAGATDFIATPFAVGDNPGASVQRTRELLKNLAPRVQSQP